MTKVLIVGDTHADDTFTANVLKAAKGNDVETVIQLGDFGFTWDKNQLDSITAWLKRDRTNKFYWLDGNHDQHDDIDEFMQDVSKNVPFNMRDVVIDGKVFPDRMYYLPRGAVFEVGDRTVLALGGAYSIDKDYRRAGVTYWPQELITDADVDRTIRNGNDTKIDVMVTHDMPCVVNIEAEMQSLGYKIDTISKGNRLRLSHVVDKVRPASLYHGHMHHRHDSAYVTPDGWHVNVHGIGANVKHGYINHNAVYNENYVIVNW